MKKSHSAKFMTNILEGVRNGFALKQNVGPPPFNRAVKTTQRARLTGEIVFVRKKNNNEMYVLFDISDEIVVGSIRFSRNIKYYYNGAIRTATIHTNPKPDVLLECLLIIFSISTWPWQISSFDRVDFFFYGLLTRALPKTRWIRLTFSAFRWVFHRERNGKLLFLIRIETGRPYITKYDIHGTS